MNMGKLRIDMWDLASKRYMDHYYMASNQKSQTLIKDLIHLFCFDFHFDGICLGSQKKNYKNGGCLQRIMLRLNKGKYF